jgi:hypothetical protein
VKPRAEALREGPVPRQSFIRAPGGGRHDAMGIVCARSGRRQPQLFGAEAELSQGHLASAFDEAAHDGSEIRPLDNVRTGGGNDDFALTRHCHDVGAIAEEGHAERSALVDATHAKVTVPSGDAEGVRRAGQPVATNAMFEISLPKRHSPSRIASTSFAKFAKRDGITLG